MTVRELVEKLEDFGIDQDAEIEVEHFVVHGHKESVFNANSANWVRVRNGRVVIY